MHKKNGDVSVNYFVICDQVITEGNTRKQSLIGIYSAFNRDRLPVTENLAIAISVRVPSVQRRDLTFRFVGPRGDVIFSSPSLPYTGPDIEASMGPTGFTTLQMSFNVHAIPFNEFGVYTAELYGDGGLLASCPLIMQRTP